MLTAPLVGCVTDAGLDLTSTSISLASTSISINTFWLVTAVSPLAVVLSSTAVIVIFAVPIVPSVFVYVNECYSTITIYNSYTMIGLCNTVN